MSAICPVFTCASEIAIVLYLLVVSTIGQGQHAFKHQTAFKNTVCPSEDIVTTLMLQSRLQCSVVCRQMSTCRKFMFNDNTKDCVICRGMYFKIHEFEAATGYRHYSDLTSMYTLFILCQAGLISTVGFWACIQEFAGVISGSRNIFTSCQLLMHCGFMITTEVKSVEEQEQSINQINTTKY